MGKKLGLVIAIIIVGLVYAAWGKPVLAPTTPTPRPVDFAQLDTLLAARHYQAAIELLEQLAITYPDLPHPLLHMGQIYLAQHREHLAMDAFNRALARDPQNAIALAGLAEVALQQQKVSLSIEQWQKAALLDPRYYNGLGRAYLAQLNFEAAQTAFAHPNNAESNWYLATLAAPTDPQLAQRYLEVITDTQFITSRDYLSQTLAPFLAQNKSHNLAKTVGIALSQLEQWPLAVHALQIAHEISPDEAETLVFLGQAQAKMGLPAFDSFEQAAQLAPESVMVLTLYGQYLRQQGAFRAALVRLEQAAQLDRENAAIFAEIAATKNALGDLGTAERWYQIAIAVAEDKLTFELLLAEFYVERNYQIKEAGLPLVEGLVKIYPDNATVQDLHGWMLFLTGDFPAAEVALQRAVSLKPDFIQAQYHLARVLTVNGKPIDAATAYQAVIDGDTQGGWRDLAQRALQNAK